MNLRRRLAHYFAVPERAQPYLRTGVRGSTDLIRHTVEAGTACSCPSGLVLRLSVAQLSGPATCGSSEKGPTFAVYSRIRGQPDETSSLLLLPLLPAPFVPSPEGKDRDQTV